MAYGGGGGGRRRFARRSYRSRGASKYRRVYKRFGRFSKLHNRKDWAPMWIKRGSQVSLGAFGTDWASANEAQRAERRAAGFYGRGLYGGPGRLGRGLYGGRGGFGQDVGRALGGLFGPVGASVGGFLGNIGGRFTGTGAYDGALATPTSEAVTVANDTVGAGVPIPAFSGGDQQGDTQLTYKEYISDIYGPSDLSFQNTSFELNPGVARTFPFLSQIAANFEEYEFVQLMFYYRASVNPSMTDTGQSGEIIMATNYNPSQPEYADKQTMLQSALAASGKVNENQIHGVECDPTKLSGNPGKYVRSGPVNQWEDLKSYDLAKLNVAVGNIPAAYKNQTLGQLWVSYTVKLRKPRRYTMQGYGLLRDTFGFDAKLAGGVSTGSHPLFTTDDPIQLSNGLLTGQQNRIGCKVISGGVGTGMTKIIFPDTFSGSVEIKLTVLGTAVADKNPLYSFVLPTGSLAANVRPVYDLLHWVPGTTTPDWRWFLQTPENNATSNTTVSCIAHVKVDVPSNGLDNEVWIQCIAEVAATLPGCILDITQYNTLFNNKQDGQDDRITFLDTAGQSAVM
jgi:hypothetical protein